MVDRRHFLKYAFAAAPPLPALYACASTAAAPAPAASYPIATDVFTTLQHTVVPAPRPATPVHLSEVSKFRRYGYGTWSLGAPLKPETRTDLMPAGHARPPTSDG